MLHPSIAHKARSSSPLPPKGLEGKTLEVGYERSSLSVTATQSYSRLNPNGEHTCN